MKFQLLGHRGSGASDAPFNRERDAQAGIARPDENTIESHLAALANGADGTETDLIETIDNNIVLVHANDYSQHILQPHHHNETTRNKRFVGQLTTREIETQLNIGMNRQSRIPTLEKFLTEVQRRFPKAFLNLELKGLQDTRPTHQNFSLTVPSLAEKTIRIIESANFPLKQIRFSSFAVSYLDEMADACPEAELGLLFDLPQDQEGDVGIPMFRDRDDVYQPFTVAAMEKALDVIPTLKAVHPEIQSLNHRNVGFAARHGLKIATWGWREYSPLGDSAGNQHFAGAVKKAFNLCSDHKVKELIIITDHIRDMRAFIGSEERLNL